MIGIVILNYLAYKETINCIYSILDTYKEKYKVYVVDNNSNNESYDSLKETFRGNTNINIIKNTVNSGYSAGNNIGIKQAIQEGCEFILISNSDIIFHKNSIKEMKNFLIKNSNVGIVGPKVLNKSGEIDKKSRMFLKTGIKEKLFARTKLRRLNYKNLYREYYGLDKSYNEEHEVFALSGCCFMMSKKIAELITPFDENTFLYEEEVIIGIRAAATGLKTFYVPSAVVTHFHAVSSKYIGAYSLIHLVNSEIYYCKRYLNAKIYKILPIYLVRVLLYLSRCINDTNYRKNIAVFLKQTQKRLWSKDGLGNR
ncbi:MAG TPA: glycosyltransferase family 2 protein [Bacillus sp. (in: firmicutes)]|nr:glycosyltransferase family 2 protein [Bacillus sp. (in: firmicutes)]